MEGNAAHLARESRLIWLPIGITLALVVAAVAAIVLLVGSPSAAAWVAPKLHMATQAQLATVQQEALDAETRLDDLESAQGSSDLQGTVDDLSTTVDELSSTVDDLSSKVDDACSAIDDLAYGIQDITGVYSTC